MRRLIAGMESEERVRLLLQLTSIRSEGITNALIDHLVKGHSVAMAAALNSERDKNIRRAVDVVEGVADVVERIKEIDWLSKVRVSE